MKTKMMALVAVVTMMASAAWAAGDTSALHPPAGSRMALVVFEDLQCPACAKAEPLLEQAGRNYNLPLVRHDFIIPNHTWSKEAHIMARYFDSQSPKLGEEFRAYIFANQSAIYKLNLRDWADKFAKAHNTALPAFYDPTGALRAKVEADTQLGRVTGETGVTHTPTIYVVSDSKQMPYVEVKDTEKLFDTIEQVKKVLPKTALPAKAKAKTKSMNTAEKPTVAQKKMAQPTVANKETPPVEARDTAMPVEPSLNVPSQNAAPVEAGLARSAQPEPHNWTPLILGSGLVLAVAAGTAFLSHGKKNVVKTAARR